MRVVATVVVAGVLALAGIAARPDDGSNQLGILIGPGRAVGDGLARVAQLDLPILDIRFAGRLIIVSRESHASGRAGLDDLRGRLPADMILLNASGATCAALQKAARL